MLESLQRTENTETRTGKVSPLLRKAVAVMGVAGAFASASPAMTAASGAHEAAHHRNVPAHETPVQKAVTNAAKTFAATIIALHNQARGNQPYQGVAYVPACPPDHGEQIFCVEYPTGTNIVTNGGKTENIGTGWYRLRATLSYPRTQKRPPGKINLNDLSDLNISEELPSAGFGANYLTPFYGFDARAGGNQWELVQEISTAAGRDDWVYVTGTGNLGNGGISHSSLTMKELHDETGLAQTFLQNAEHYIVTPITPALEASLPTPTKRYPPIPPPQG